MELAFSNERLLLMAVISPLSRGIYVGRFQPFHSGHVAAIKFALESCSELIVGISHLDANLTWTNPFSCRERMDMIWRTLDLEQRGRCLISPIPNQSNNFLWLEYVRQYVPDFSVAFTNNQLQALIMEQAGIVVRPIDFTRRDEFQGAVVRELLSTGDPRWHRLVSKGTRDVLENIGAERRLRILKKIAFGSEKDFER